MSNLFTFTGRLGRLAYFGYTVLLVLLGTFGALAASVLRDVSGFLTFVLIAVIIVVMAWSGLSIAVRRLHDLDMSGWHYVWMAVIPDAIASFGQSQKSMLITAVGSLMALAFLLFLIFWPGTPGRNSYG